MAATQAGTASSYFYSYNKKLKLFKNVCRRTLSLMIYYSE